jgi:hypothetical protein
MSRLTLYEVHPGVSACGSDEEMHNAFNFAPLIWEAVRQRYRPDVSDIDAMLISDIWDDSNVSAVDNALLAMTFDNAYVLERDYERAASDLRDFMAAYWVSGHLPLIEMVFRHALITPAVGFGASQNTAPFGLQDAEPFDWSRAFNVYEHVDIKMN